MRRHWFSTLSLAFKDLTDSLHLQMILYTGDNKNPNFKLRNIILQLLHYLPSAVFHRVMKPSSSLRQKDSTSLGCSLANVAINIRSTLPTKPYFYFICVLKSPVVFRAPSFQVSGVMTLPSFFSPVIIRICSHKYTYKSNHPIKRCKH